MTYVRGEEHEPRQRVIVDAQIHLWPPSTPERPWIEGASRPQLDDPMTIDRARGLMDDAGVDRAIIVPPSLEGDRLDYGQSAARRFPGRFAIMGRIAFDDPSGPERFRTWREQPGVLGIRLSLKHKEMRAIDEGLADWFWPSAAAARVPIMFLAPCADGLFAEIARRNPELTLIVDHMGVSPDAIKEGRLQDCIAATERLARYPNISVKLSAIPMISREPYPFRDVTPYIRRLYDAYGPQRCHWGADLTNLFDRATYRQRVTHMTEEVPFLSEEDKDWIMGRSLLERLRWNA